MYTIYASKEEFNEFYYSENDTLIGAAYEWEGENVIHLRTKPIKHSFGNMSKAYFFKGEYNQYMIDANSFVVVTVPTTDNSSSFKVFKKTGNELIECEVNFIPAKDELYSRSKGLLEVDILSKKRVTIIGLGSFGSQISIELAKAGIGQFSLFDFDRVEIHNLARHTSYLNDLGRLKTDVLEDSIKGKNPYAVVDKFPVDINNNYSLLSEEIEKSDIVICTTDNNPSRLNISKILVEKQKIGIFGRAITRAEGGDVFRYTPGAACYSCLIGNMKLPDEEISNEDSARVQERIHQYMSANDAAAIVQVGLSSDIEPICNLIVKLALVELSRGLNSGISSLENDLTPNYYFWANRRERHYSTWATLAKPGNRPTILRWYGVQIDKNCNCPICSSEKIVLDESMPSYGIQPNLDALNDVNLDDL